MSAANLWLRRTLLLIAASGFTLIVATHLGSQQASPPKFREVAESSGLRLTLNNSAPPERHIIEPIPGATAAFAYNGDGRFDIYFTNGPAIPSLANDPSRTG